MTMQLVMVILTASLIGAKAVRTETEVQSNMSAETAIMQAGSMFDDQYVLVSKLATAGWPSGGLAGFSGIMTLGEGTFGETWLAKDQAQNQVALKFFYRDQVNGRVLLNMLNADQDEMVILKQASVECAAPDSIISAVTSGNNRFARCTKNNANSHSGPSYIVMEVAGNQNLEKYLSHRTAPSVENVLRISNMLVEALAQLQESKYVHRDIKPANIMLTVSGRDVLDLKLIDFGLTLKTTQSAWPSGTPLYMPPELWPVRVAQQLNAAHSHDVYSVGETIFETICGKTFHEQILDEFYEQENFEKKAKLETELKGPRCLPPRQQAYLDDDRVQTLFVLVAKNMMGTSGRITGTQALSKPLWTEVSPVQKPQTKQINAIAADQEQSFLKQCHSSKKYWFDHLVKCCAEEKPDALRSAICDKPCGANVGYKPGQQCFDQSKEIPCGSDNKQFSKKLFCCVSKQYPDTCDYVGLWDNEKRRRLPTLPQGQGWAWLSGPEGGVKLPTKK